MHCSSQRAENDLPVPLSPLKMIVWLLPLQQGQSSPQGPIRPVARVPIRRPLAPIHQGQRDAFPPGRARELRSSSWACGHERKRDERAGGRGSGRVRVRSLLNTQFVASFLADLEQVRRECSARPMWPLPRRNARISADPRAPASGRCLRGWLHRIAVAQHRLAVMNSVWLRGGCVICEHVREAALSCVRARRKWAGGRVGGRRGKGRGGMARIHREPAAQDAPRVSSRATIRKRAGCQVYSTQRRSSTAIGWTRAWAVPRHVTSPASHAMRKYTVWRPNDAKKLAL